VHDASENSSQMKFPVTLGVTSAVIKKNEIMHGSTNIKMFEMELDNFANFPHIVNFLFTPLRNNKGKKLGVAQFFNCRVGDITENVVVFL